MPPGLYQYSIIVSTPQREMKFTASSKERHDMWLEVRDIRIGDEQTLIISSGTPILAHPARLGA
jgi:hypothetical protein